MCKATSNRRCDLWRKCGDGLKRSERSIASKARSDWGVDSFHGGNPQRFVEAEGKHRLYRLTDGTALRQDLGECTRTGARISSNGRTLTSAGDGADDCTERRAAPGILRGALVRSYPRFSFWLISTVSISYERRPMMTD